MTAALKQAIKEKARQLGFTLAGVTSCAPPAQYALFENWLGAGRHGSMEYLAEDRSRTRRANPCEILPECRSILVLAMPYTPPDQPAGIKIASYALGADYHDIIPPRLKQLVEFIEEHTGASIPNRYYTDTGPILERELAQRAGLGWIGKNSCLINPKAGSTFFLAEILLGIEIEPDPPFQSDQCGSCTRCVSACPTQCILPDRTLDARRCISYLTIEHKGEIDPELRPLIKDWAFGCDICQQVCPWNRFSLPADRELEAKLPLPVQPADLTLSAAEFNQRFKTSPVKRAKRRGYLRNLAVSAGNSSSADFIPALQSAAQDEEPLISEHARWALERFGR